MPPESFMYLVLRMACGKILQASSFLRACSAFSAGLSIERKMPRSIGSVSAAKIELLAAKRQDNFLLIAVS